MIIAHVIARGVRMRKHIIICLSLFVSLSAFANCEMMSRGYHTIASYYKEDPSLTKELFFFDLQEIDPFIYLNNKKQFLKNNIERQFNIDFDMVVSTIKYIEFNGKICNIDGKKEVILSSVSPVQTIRLKNCVKKKLQNHSNIVVYNNKESSLNIPVHQEIETKDTNTESLTDEIKQAIQKIKVKGSPDYLINTKNMEFIEVTHKTIDKIGTVYSVAKVKATKLGMKYKERYSKNATEEKLDSFNFYIIFLSRPGKKLWYIGDSGQNHCSNTIENQVEKKNGDFYVGYPLEIFTSLDMNSDGAADLISFGSKDMMYYIDYGKKLSVMRNTGQWLNQWNEDYANSPLKKEGPDT